MRYLIAILLSGFLDRVRGGGSAALPLTEMWRWVSFFGLGLTLYGLASGWNSLLAGLAFGVGMWLSGKLLGWTGVYRGLLGIPQKREWWQVGPLKDYILASVTVNLVWGLGGTIVVGLAEALGMVPDGSMRMSLVVPVSLAVAGTAAPLIAKRIVPVDRWFTDEKFFLSTWGVMEFTRGLLAGLLCALGGMH